MHNILFTVVHKISKGKKYNTSVHKFFEIVYIIEGKACFTINKRVYTVGKNNILLLPPDTYHQEQAVTDVSILYIGLLNDEKIKNIIAPTVLDYNNIELIFSFRSILKEMVNTFHNKDLCIDNYISIIIIYIHRFIFTGNISIRNNNAFIDNSISYFNKYFAKQIDVGKISGHFNISKNYFSSIFKKKTGLPPGKYLNELRIDVAKKMLLNKKIRIKKISEMIGFQDPYYFSRIFKKICGMSPQEFREQY